MEYSDIVPSRLRHWLQGTSILLLLALAASIEANALSPEQEAPSTSIADSKINMAIVHSLQKADAVPSHLLDVFTEDGIVSLKGSVDNARARRRAQAIAETIKGVRSVINRIQVSPVERSDSDIRREVKQALLYDPVTDSYEIDIEVDEGVVTLEGNVDSWAEKLLALNVTEGIRGVRNVENLIKVDYRIIRPDKEIEQELKRKLDADVWIDASSVDVKVSEGRVTLSGKTGSAAEKTRVYSASWVQGVWDVEASSLNVDPDMTAEMKREKKVYARSDDEIENAIHAAFTYDPRVFSFNPEVSVESGDVVLTGYVDNLAAKRAAEEDVWNTVGVWSVQNLLKVRPKVLLDDDSLYNRIHQRLSADNNLSRTIEGDLRMVVRNGKVSLYGTVDTSFDKWLTGDLVSKVNGVVAVDNFLKVNARPFWKPDRVIENEVAYELFWSPFVDSNKVSIEVNEGVVTLQGTVDSIRERNAAAENAFQGGARVLENKLEVSGSENSAHPDYSPNFNPPFFHGRYLPPVG